MGVRIGGHVGPVSASTRVRGRGCLPWLAGAVVIGALVKYWYVVVPVLAVVILSVIAVKVRDKRRAQRQPRPQAQPIPQAQWQPQRQFPYDPRTPQPPNTYAPRPTFTPRNQPR